MIYPWRRRLPRRTDIWPRWWRRRPAAAVAVLLAAALLAWSRLGTPGGSDYDRYHDKVFNCARVIDGDTLDVAVPDGRRPHTRIRLWGVDTPEVEKGGRQPMYFGPEAAEFASGLVQGRPVRVVLWPPKTRDKYGRLLAYVYLDGSEKMLNEELVIRGYGYADPRFEHPWKTRFGELERQARGKKVGLWKKVTPEQYPPWRQRYGRHKE